MTLVARVTNTFHMPARLLSVPCEELCRGGVVGPWLFEPGISGTLFMGTCSKDAKTV